MLFWGSEFVDDGSYGAPILSGEEYVAGGTVLPIDVITLIVDPIYIAEISSKDRSRIDYLTSSMAENGMLHPGTLTYDSRVIRLKDGNHRYLAAKALGWTEFRVEVRRVSNIQAPGLALEQLVPTLISRGFDR